VKRFINDLGYELKNDKYINNRQKLTLVDKEGYYYVSTYDYLQRNNTPLRFSAYNPHTIENIKNWCIVNNKNFKLIDNTYVNKNIKLLWRCLKESCGDLFYASWTQIYAGKGCGVCHGKQIGLSNCLAYRNPELSKEWYPTKNGKITPFDVTYSSGKEFYWQCKNNKEHVWKANISSRNRNGCPYCSGRLGTKEYNLLVVYPNVCKSWDYGKNINNPEFYTPKSGQSVWWICEECGYKWKNEIRNMVNSRGCPECNMSKGEQVIKNWLKLHSICYIYQKEFEGLVGLKGMPLSYDFYLPNEYNLLIEYQGEFHDGGGKEYTKANLEYQQEHDRRKREYAENNNINLLEIWYYDFDKIEDILLKNLKHIKRIRND